MSVARQAGSLRGHRVLVAGGDGEIGAAISADAAADGADVAVAGIDGEAASKVAAGLSGTDTRATGLEVDITDADSVHGMQESLTRLWGGIDVLINCAGIMRVGAAEELPEQAWREVVDTNLTGAFLLSQAAGRMMIADQQGGRIVQLSSVRGTVGLAIGGFAAYGASKAGLNLLVKQLAAEWGQHGIHVNAVAAGFVATTLSATAGDQQDFQRMVATRTPLGRVAEVREVADAALYLASPRAGFITGQILFVDGGLTATQ
jgi:NAD(P)-dependent dehydrogenase (short-subunit alcohol dehydrogenase family)